MRFRVQDDFWTLFPDARIGIVVARGVNNHSEGHEDTTAQLDQAIAAAAARLDGVDMPAHPAVAPWRQAYQAFGMKPSKFRSSIESLLRSAQAGRLRSISPLVNVYNTVSLRHMLPCGGEDLAHIQGDIQLTRATGGEPFRTIGAEKDEPPQPGEVIYRDDAGVICRAWNWRESDRTRLTEQTSDAFLCIEALAVHGEAALRAACDELAALVAAQLGGTTRVELVSSARPAIDL
jgi:DNA/RNA-binding domain of Phe-tRNA-synthetase-like protein